MGVWDSFQQGMQIGGALRTRANQREQGEAYQQGGWEAFADTAAGQGDTEAMAYGAQQQTAQESSLLETARGNATVLSNVANSLAGIPYEQRAQALQRVTPLLENMGISPEQVAGFDPTDENLAVFGGLAGEFEKYSDIRQQGNQTIGITRDGRAVVIHEGQQPAPSGYRRTAEGNLEFEPGGPADPANPLNQRRFSSGGTQYSPITPEQAQQYGLPGDGAGFVMGDNGLPRRVGGGGTFPAEQRARVAITYQAALEATQQIEQADSAARQNNTTPYGQDWGAAVVNAPGVVPFDNGMVGRAIGGADYQQYVRASSAFEAAMLPILSGAAVTESEAQRTVRAALPQFGDGPEVLQRKARMRRQMLNGAAMIGGMDPPYPEDGVPGWASQASAAVTQVGGDFDYENATPEELDAREAELEALERQLTGGAR